MVIIGLVTEGGVAIPTLMVEATRLIVFAGLLWGLGDMALMLIESNHDQRATRILLGRINNKLEQALGPGLSPGEGDPPERPRADAGPDGNRRVQRASTARSSA